MEDKMVETDSYDASKILVLEGPQGIRKRPSMYIGSTGPSGVLHLLFEVMDNAVDEAMAGFCRNITVRLSQDEHGDIAEVSDDGRGIPVDFMEKYSKNALEVIMTTLHKGAKFNSDVYKIAGGLHGVGLTVVNALSEYTEVIVKKNGHTYKQKFSRGHAVSQLETVGDATGTGTTVKFKPDKEIFHTATFDSILLKDRIRYTSYLTPKLTITLIDDRFVVYAGVDYKAILELAENENDIILWDGGNNDFPFYKSDLFIGIADPLRAGNELSYYPGEIVARISDILIINKVNSAEMDDVERVRADLESINPTAQIALADSVVSVDNKSLISGKRVLLVEDGPTITHGGMAFGAATVAAKEFGAAQIVNAKQYAFGTLKETYAKYPKLGNELPAMGYSQKQIKDLENTINAADADVVVSATPTDLKRIVSINKPLVQVSYELKPRDQVLDKALKAFVARMKP